MLLVFPRLLLTSSTACIQESRRAAPCGTAATEPSGLVDLSVSVRERDFSETNQGKHQEQLTYRYAGTAAGTWTRAADTAVLRPVFGSMVTLVGSGAEILNPTVHRAAWGGI